METSIILTDTDIEKGEQLTLVSPKNPTPVERIFLSNIDQTLPFPVATVSFFETPPAKKTSTLDIAERVKKSVSEVLLIPYYFMAGRLNFDIKTTRLELVCNNAGVFFSPSIYTSFHPKAMASPIATSAATISASSADLALNFLMPAPITLPSESHAIVPAAASPEQA
ncbi:hypothetical protein IFM89_020578 [Coptis chinensis]|uniref:Uncharacterized protein n=1 Tax=Coptis chinensis TaxID=261450 RepID=A0A835IB14_9MAGN|nr:hypothetical protein IFM89_020578 [Coptis chinensis]